MVVWIVVGSPVDMLVNTAARMPCDGPSILGYDLVTVPTPERRHTPAGVDHGAEHHMPAQNLVHCSPHRTTSSGMDTPGCPAANVARRQSADGPGGYQTAPHETSHGRPSAPQLRPIHHLDETQPPDERPGEPQGNVKIITNHRDAPPRTWPAS